MIGYRKAIHCIKRTLVAQMLLVIAASLAACSGGASKDANTGVAPGPAAGAGWTGVTKPRDVIAARAKLMEQIEQLMLPIDMLQVQKGGDPAVRSANAAAVSAMLLAVPHLFPPTTDLYDPKAETPATIALPAIWKDFDTFYNLAGAAAKAADNLAAVQGEDAQRTAGAQLRGSCDACHMLFLRKYEQPKAKASDADFDFDKALAK
ncbi:MAG TPA: cytochrome c [Candidatus Acidoferrum sp.]|nr:cytochrome c [Candidatus Acidoferrum sp.]